MSTKRAKRRPQHDANVIEFQPFKHTLPQNIPQKKQRVNVVPRNYNQEQYLHTLLDPSKNIVFALGPAGTGKTLLACQVGIKLFKEGLVDKIVVTRPAVSVDEEHGFLPGTLQEKMAPWTRPIFDVLGEYYYSRDIDNMVREGVIEISPLAYMRGRTFKNSYIIADECQLCTPSQMKMLLTRIGENSKLVITGDLEQSDRGDENGLRDFLIRTVSATMNGISIVRFEKNDIERHPVVQEVLDIYDKKS